MGVWEWYERSPEGLRLQTAQVRSWKTRGRIIAGLSRSGPRKSQPLAAQRQPFPLSPHLRFPQFLFFLSLSVISPPAVCVTWLALFTKMVFIAVLQTLCDPIFASWTFVWVFVLSQKSPDCRPVVRRNICGKHPTIHPHSFIYYSFPSSLTSLM